ncbi:MAG TPA: hypothetical protein VGM35_00105 [Xanthobacteraceae bacterium]
MAIVARIAIFIPQLVVTPLPSAIAATKPPSLMRDSAREFLSQKVYQENETDR